jgi:hypothetical protein
VDLAAEITERALEIVRSHIEAAAAHDREEAAARLLRELELEDAGKKVRGGSSTSSKMLLIKACTCQQIDHHPEINVAFHIYACHPYI